MINRVELVELIWIRSPFQVSSTQMICWTVARTNPGTLSMFLYNLLGEISSTIISYILTYNISLQGEHWATGLLRKLWEWYIYNLFCIMVDANAPHKRFNLCTVEDKHSNSTVIIVKYQCGHIVESWLLASGLN